MLKRVVSVLFLANMMWTAVAEAQERINEESVRAATQTAQDALRTFALLVEQQRNHREMGFDSPEQVHSATLGVPLREFWIRLDELQAYRSEEDPTRLLHSTEQLTFPVLVRGQTRSSITVRHVGEQWEAVSFGAPGHTRMLGSLRDRLAREQRLQPTEFFEVKVPALNVVFLGSVEEGRLLFTPLLDDSRFGFEQGVPRPANEALEVMVSAAKEHNGFPT